MRYQHHWWTQSPADVRLCRVGEPKERRGALRNAAVLSPFLSPTFSLSHHFSERACISPHHHFSTLFYLIHAQPPPLPPPPSLLHTLWISPSSSVNGEGRLMSLFLGDYRLHRLCVFPNSVAVIVWKCKCTHLLMDNCIQLPANVYKWIALLSPMRV